MSEKARMMCTNQNECQMFLYRIIIQRQQRKISLFVANRSITTFIMHCVGILCSSNILFYHQIYTACKKKWHIQINTSENVCLRNFPPHIDDVLRHWRYSCIIYLNNDPIQLLCGGCALSSFGHNLTIKNTIMFDENNLHYM